MITIKLLAKKAGAVIVQAAKEAVIEAVETAVEKGADKIKAEAKKAVK
jgi:hypothetical protein